jgi:catechol 2,3-dioxygenase-like lactoylglutathione lyase family enzyme
MIEGLSHLTFIVSDLERMTTFLTKIFDAEEVYAGVNDAFSITNEKHFLISGTWVVIMEGNTLSKRTYNHIAFKISEDQFNIYEERIRSLGVDIYEGRDRVDDEGRSLYFYDDDNHLFELHTGTMDQRLKYYKNQA